MVHCDEHFGAKKCGQRVSCGTRVDISVSIQGYFVLGGGCEGREKRREMSRTEVYDVKVTKNIFSLKQGFSV